MRKLDECWREHIWTVSFALKLILNACLCLCDTWHCQKKCGVVKLKKNNNNFPLLARNKPVQLLKWRDRLMSSGQQGGQPFTVNALAAAGGRQKKKGTQMPSSAIHGQAPREWRAAVPGELRAGVGPAHYSKWGGGDGGGEVWQDLVLKSSEQWGPKVLFGCIVVSAEITGLISDEHWDFPNMQ